MTTTTDPEVHLSTPAHAARWLFDALRPSFLSSRRAHKKVTTTSYLDGLRGFAAFMVYWQHHQGWARLTGPANDIFENAYGYQDRYYFASLPGFRLLFTGGHLAVAVFFVLSGYVLALKPLSLIHAGNIPKLEENLASAMFRRWLRLHIPVLGTTFFYMTSWHLFNLWPAYPDHKSTYTEELWTWYQEFGHFTFMFRDSDPPWTNYNVHLWSIPVEFRGSVVIYTMLLIFSRSTRNARLWCSAGLLVYFLYFVDGWFCAMFIAGMMICDLEMLARNDDLPSFFTKLAPFHNIFFHLCFLISLYVGGVPSRNPDIDVLRSSPGWHYLSYLKPDAMRDSKWFFLFWGSTLLVLATTRLSWLRRFFELPFNQYLGRISFGLYLMHGPVLWILGDRLYAAVGYKRDFRFEELESWYNILPLSKNAPLGLEIAFWAPHLILLPATLWCAEIATRLFDVPSIRFSQWAYRQVLASVDGK